MCGWGAINPKSSSETRARLTLFTCFRLVASDSRFASLLIGVCACVDSVNISHHDKVAFKHLLLVHLQGRSTNVTLSFFFFFFFFSQGTFLCFHLFPLFAVVCCCPLCFFLLSFCTLSPLQARRMPPSSMCSTFSQVIGKCFNRGSKQSVAIQPPRWPGS